MVYDISGEIISHIKNQINLRNFYVLVNKNELDVSSIIKYSQNDKISDIINKSVKQSIVQKYHANDIVSEIIKDRFINYPMNDYPEIYFHHKDIPLFLLSHDNNKSEMVISVDIFSVLNYYKETVDTSFKIAECINKNKSEKSKYYYSFFNETSALMLGLTGLILPSVLVGIVISRIYIK